MSTEPDSTRKPDRFRTLASKSETDPKNARSTAEVELEKKLSFERDARKEDRYVFMIVLVVIFNAWGLQNATTWTLPLLVGVLELFALVVLARRFGVQEIQYWLNQFLAHMGPGSPKTDRHKTRAKDESKASPNEPAQASNDKEDQ